MIKTIELILFIVLALIIGYAVVRGIKEAKRAKEIQDKIVDVESVIRDLKANIEALEKKASSGYSEAESQLQYYKTQLKQVEELQNKLTTQDPDPKP